MREIVFIYTEDHKTFKNYIKGKRGTIPVSYIDIRESQEKYMVLEGETFSNEVLACELYDKLYTSIRKLKDSDKYYKIYYFLDTYNEKIIQNIFYNIDIYCKKISLRGLDKSILLKDYIPDKDLKFLEKHFKIIIDEKKEKE